MVLVMGTLATFFSLMVAQIGDIWDIMISVVNTFGGPLLGMFLLGIFTRRATGAAAIVALVLGTLITIWVAFAARIAAAYPVLDWLWPWEKPISSFWPLTVSVVVTVLLGYALSFFIGQRKSRTELNGLVLGVGKLGHVPGRRPDWETATPMVQTQQENGSA